MNTMKTHSEYGFFILSFMILLTFSPTKAHNVQKKFPKNSLSNSLICQHRTVPDEIPTDSTFDGSIFHIDDSLLCETYPSVLVNGRTPENEVNTFQYNEVWHVTPKETLSKNFLILVNGTLYPSIKEEVRTYVEDVHASYGYGIYLLSVVNASYLNIKDIIIGYEENLCGVFLIGDFQECLFEINNDHEQYGYRKWPCDLFFTDLNGVWLDTDGNGIFDQHTGDVKPEIFLGRLSATGMDFYGSEISLIKDQLAKSHNFWWDESFHLNNDTILNYIDRDWAHTFNVNGVKKALRSCIVDDIKNNNSSPFSKSDYLNRLSDDKYGFTFLAAHSCPNYHLISRVNTNAYEISQHESKNFAYNLFCCSACNWMASNLYGYLGGVYLFCGDRTVAVIGSTKTGAMSKRKSFHDCLETNNIGYSLKEWWGSAYGNQHDDTDISWSYGMTILGDPTIYLWHDVSDILVSEISLNSFPNDDNSNLVLFKAKERIHVEGGFSIPVGVHVIFEAPEILIDSDFNCPLGATFELRN